MVESVVEMEVRLSEMREKSMLLRSGEVVDMRKGGELMKVERMIEKLYWQIRRGC